MNDNNIDQIIITDLEGFSTEELLEMLEQAKAKNSLLFKYFSDKVQKLKEQNWEKIVITSKEVAESNVGKGFAKGIEWVAEAEYRIAEEIERREEEKKLKKEEREKEKKESKLNKKYLPEL